MRTTLQAVVLKPLAKLVGAPNIEVVRAFRDCGSKELTNSWKHKSMALGPYLRVVPHLVSGQVH